jgi:hypothetical protein
VSLVCPFCGDEITADQLSRTYRLVKGWVRNRGVAGGANHVVLAEDLSERAHVGCVNVARAIEVPAESLFA